MISSRDAGDEQILGFERVWVRPGGKVVAYVTLNPNTGGRTFGVLSAVVTLLGTVTQVHDVIYDGDALPPATGTLFALDSDEAKVDEGGTFFCMANMDDGDIDLFSIECDGSGVTRTIGSGDSLPGGTNARHTDGHRHRSVGRAGRVRRVGRRRLRADLHHGARPGSAG